MTEFFIYFLLSLSIKDILVLYATYKLLNNLTEELNNLTEELMNAIPYVFINFMEKYK